MALRLKRVQTRAPQSWGWRHRLDTALKSLSEQDGESRFSLNSWVPVWLYTGEYHTQRCILITSLDTEIFYEGSLKVRRPLKGLWKHWKPDLKQQPWDGEKPVSSDHIWPILSDIWLDTKPCDSGFSLPPPIARPWSPFPFPMATSLVPSFFSDPKFRWPCPSPEQETHEEAGLGKTMNSVLERLSLTFSRLYTQECKSGEALSWKYPHLAALKCGAPGGDDTSGRT